MNPTVSYALRCAVSCLAIRLRLTVRGEDLSCLDRRLLRSDVKDAILAGRLQVRIVQRSWHAYLRRGLREDCTSLA